MTVFLISAYQVLVVLYSIRTFPDINQGKIIPLMRNCFFLLLPQLLCSVHVKGTQLLNTEISFAFITSTGSVYQRALEINNCQKPHSSVTVLLCLMHFRQCFHCLKSWSSHCTISQNCGRASPHWNLSMPSSKVFTF